VYILQRRLSLSNEAAITPKAGRSTVPSYEYSSIYRDISNKTLEWHVTSQLHDLKAQLLAQSPSTLAEPHIWQVGLEGLEDHYAPLTQQWTINNPDWEYSLLTSASARAFVHEHFAAIPAILATYEALPTSVLKADFLRYLVLWARGGLYADIDTWNRVAVNNCAPMAAVVAGDRKVALLVGVEIDEPFGDEAMHHQWHWSRGFGVGQFVIWAPHRFGDIVTCAVVRTVSHFDAHVAYSHGGVGEEDVLEVTGPGMWTDCLLDHLSERLDPESALRDPDAGLERRVTWKAFHALEQPIWVEGIEGQGVGILPIDVWGNGQRHSNAGNFSSATACVNHVFGRAWKKGWYEWMFG
jgi:alpha 1,6-mannosyltransferase